MTKSLKATWIVSRDSAADSENARFALVMRWALAKRLPSVIGFGAAGHSAKRAAARVVAANGTPAVRSCPGEVLATVKL